jgi:2-keto-4-pentenoate hydratase/2-oxohepta-3-ene-1,7-dioic acid hydratase in catechol pathway
MILLNFRYPRRRQYHLGLKTETGILDVTSAAADLKAGRQVPKSLEAVLAGGVPAVDALRAWYEPLAGSAALNDWLVPEAGVTYGPCASRSGKVICVGLNYRPHAAESNMAVPDYPLLFSKFGSSLTGAGQAVALPAGAEQFDYEAEMAVIIGRRASRVSEADALGCVLGYCNANDISARDLQFRTSQWLLGKALDGFLPVGPYLVTADEISDPQNLGIRCWVNGELCQNANTVDMIFSTARLISYTSAFMTLEPGDLISTGTPEGVIFGKANKIWLKAGDELTVEVDRLGRLTNRLAAPE